MLNLEEEKYAEPIFYFVEEHLNEYYEDITELGEMSMCEYIQRVRYDEFVSWCKEWYPNL